MFVNSLKSIKNQNKITQPHLKFLINKNPVFDIVKVLSISWLMFENLKGFNISAD